jgi:hypothetical protein
LVDGTAQVARGSVLVLIMCMTESPMTLVYPSFHVAMSCR